MEITGRLEDWYRVDNTFFGKIYGDQKGRFKDGEMIKTSRAKYIPEDLSFVQTMNSRYQLGHPFSPKPKPTPTETNQ